MKLETNLGRIGVIGLIGFGSAVTLIGSYAYVKYPPLPCKHKVGDQYKTSEGVAKVVVGYSGHDQFVKFENDRPLWYGTKREAQWYARNHNNPTCYTVISNQEPTKTDFQEQTNLFLDPILPPSLLPEAVKRLDLELVEPEAVDYRSGARVIDAVQRMIFGS